jgi:uncharacterized protein YdcH (DUF465 family)
MRLIARSVPDLIAQHDTLDQRIKKLDRRGDHLTPPERELSTELKKLRLLAKDKLASLGRL